MTSKPWTDEEVTALTVMWKTTATIWKIADVIERTARACTQKAHRLHLPRKPYASYPS